MYPENIINLLKGENWTYFTVQYLQGVSFISELFFCGLVYSSVDTKIEKVRLFDWIA